VASSTNADRDGFVQVAWTPDATGAYTIIVENISGVTQRISYSTNGKR
jgi:hypothetical protein